jgi:signal transduction histidine kinase
MERKLAERLRRLRLPLVALLPAIVVVVGVATAFAVGLLALWHLRTTSDQLSSTRATVLASTLGLRLRATAAEDHGEFARRAARRTGAEVLVCTQGGEIQVDATFGPPTRTDLVALLVAEQGETETRIGRTRYSASSLGAPFQNVSVVVFVPAPLQPEGAQALVRSVVGLTALLIGVAAIVAYLFARDLHDDVDFVRRRIVAMADPRSSPTGASVPIRVADQVGVLTHAFNILVDRFTAAERAYQRDLQRVASLDRDRSAFLGALSHELRTPLNAILGFADVLLSEVDGKLDSDAKENLEMVRASGSHLRGLIDDILELSAIESGQLRLSRAMVDLRAIAEDVIREASARVIGMPITMEVTGDSPALVFADERRVWQILSNLVGNATKFTGHGSVTVHIEVGERDAVISVIDTGTGIPQTEIEAIFDEYRQLGSSNMREKGAGLGLFIARKLVTMHGGTISVRSQLGRGSEFTLRLPVWGSGELAGAAGVGRRGDSSRPKAVQGGAA